MKTYLECIPCFFKQALHAAKLAGANPKTQKEILTAIALGKSNREIGIERGIKLSGADA